jgi:hypothetical protein
MTSISSSIAKIYIQGPLKRNEDEFYTLLPTILSTGTGIDDIICNPFLEKSHLNCQTIFNVYDPFLTRGPIPPFTSNAPHLNLNEVSQTLSFASILQNAAQLPNPDNSAIIILDSKAVVRRDILERLKGIFENEASSNWECLSLAYTPKSLPEDASYFADAQIFEQEPMTPITSGAVAIRLSLVKKMVKTILPFRDPLDYELIFQTLLHKSPAKYVFPPIFDCGR